MAMHYGVYYDENAPTTGVVNANAVEFLHEDIDSGIDLTAEEAHRDWQREFANKYDILNMDEVEDHEEYEYEEQEFWDDYESQDSTYLIGSWKKGEDGKYEPDPDAKGAEYAAIVSEFYVQVLWSKRVVGVRAMCSPCFPGQADLDSGDGDILAYALPDDLMGF